jgi:hypothetical protein
MHCIRMDGKHSGDSVEVSLDGLTLCHDIEFELRKTATAICRGVNIPVLVGQIFRDLFQFIPDIPGFFKGNCMDPSTPPPCPRYGSVRKKSAVQTGGVPWTRACLGQGREGTHFLKQKKINVQKWHDWF